MELIWTSLQVSSLVLWERLDSETSIQVMELLKQVAKDRLVVMVTHNPKLAKKYANRIVQLKDGRVTDDTSPFEMADIINRDIVPVMKKKASMSPLTALSLSFHNLGTKKGRTILTSFAGAIGIIGIALILSLSNGVSAYMNDIQKNTMTSYPITIEKESVDLTGSFTEKHKDVFTNKEADHAMDAVYSTGEDLQTKANLANMLEEYLQNPEDEEMLEAYAQLIPPTTYESNMEKFGFVDMASPSAISIYADNFENKEAISMCIDTYNSSVSEEDQIQYTDYVRTLMSSVTTIINVVSYVLMAFVAVSLIVSSIMIGIITYISVLERTKEIGILRAIGASKYNISQVFSAETFIIGLFLGAIGIEITLLLLIPGNMIIHSLEGITTINASLPISGSLVLVLLSVVLTLIGGFIPARHAARKDPVSALRSE